MFLIGWIRSWLAALKASYWLLPALLAVAAMLLCELALQLDERWSELARWGYSGEAEGARSVLSVIASSMIGVAGVIFSITVVSLTMAASQLGPRLLRTFLSDRGNQFVLGVYIGTYLYSVLALRAVTGDGVVPRITVTLAIGLSLLSLAALIYFIHNVTRSLQADRVVSRVAGDLLRAIDRFGDRFDERTQDGNAQLEWQQQVCSSADGYVQAIEYLALRDAAARVDAVVELSVRAGHFVCRGTVLARLSREDDGLARAIEAATRLGPLRTEEQDVEYALNQLVEVALRALSPGVNDPFTALACIDWLGAALARASDMGPVPNRICDADQQLRLITAEPDFAGLASGAFDPIRQAAAGSPAVLIRLADTLATLASRSPGAEVMGVLVEHADSLEATCGAAGLVGNDSEAVQRRLRRLRRTLQGQA